MSTFVPSVIDIIGINNAQTATITFATDHNFFLGEIISLRSSQPYGMFEINNKQAKIISLTSDTITVDLDTLRFNAFVYPPVGTVQQVAQVVPSASGIIPGQYVATVTLEDAFDNVPN